MYNKALECHYLRVFRFLNEGSHGWMDGIMKRPVGMDILAPVACLCPASARAHAHALAKDGPWKNGL
jgi:hypothetical protein